MNMGRSLLVALAIIAGCPTSSRAAGEPVPLVGVMAHRAEWSGNAVPVWGMLGISRGDKIELYLDEGRWRYSIRLNSVRVNTDDPEPTVDSASRMSRLSAGM
ncbi:hypothetical protein ACQQ2N_14320 [Dokdonella sp. MW10]|uniref:hypothetical protein n=1 Tax=Dokdonella sp. MW10 TaxID=2992926 RepID=UPI003F7F3BF9